MMMVNGNVKEPFVGREKEVIEFSQWLANSNPDAPRILSVYETQTDPSKQGGVGKSRLLRKFSDIVKQTLPNSIIAYVDFFNIADRDAVAIAQRVASALKTAYPEWNTSHSDKALEEYNKALYEGKDIVERRVLFADAFVDDLSTLDATLKSTDSSLFIFFDTYEVVERNPLSTLLRPEQRFPDSYELTNLKVVIAGRNKIDLDNINWRGREAEIQNMPISAFTLTETREYFDLLTAVNISDPDDVQAIFERTEGRPILIGLVDDVLSKRVSTSKGLISIPKEQFEASLVAKINGLGQPIDRIILFMAHAYHRFNLRLLNWIPEEGDLLELQSEVNLEKTAEELLNLSFVRRPGSGNDFVLHDEMRPLVNRYCWDVQDPDRSFRISLSEAVIKYYEDELQHLESEQLKQTYKVELLYHKLFVHLGDGYTYFSENFLDAERLRLNSFARSLLREANQFKNRMSPEQLYDLKFDEARLFSQEEAAEPALRLLDEVKQEASPSWLELHSAKLLSERGIAYQQLSLYAEAIECFEAAMDIEKQHGNMSEYAYLLNWVGSTHQRQGHLDTALKAYEEGLNIHKELHDKRATANALLNISSVYRLQGRVEEALRQAKTSLRIRNELSKEGNMSEMYVGWSIYTIGTVYYQVNDIPSANAAFQDALDIFNRTGYKRGIAMVYNRLGKIEMDNESLFYAQRSFERAHLTARGIDKREQVNSLNKLGWVAVLEKRYPRAIELLQEAIDLAKNIHDEYQQAESLVDLAEAFQRAGQDEEARQARQEAEQICQKNHYYYLLSVSRLSEGDILYEARSYTNAFRYYGQACYYMTRYNQLEYNKTLRTLIDKLLETPSQEINPIVDSLVAYWSSQGLEKGYPDFISSCEEVRSILGF
jgi:tetratricopeptide (TPR) repeat protein